MPTISCETTIEGDRYQHLWDTYVVNDYSCDIVEEENLAEPKTDNSFTVYDSHANGNRSPYHEKAITGDYDASLDMKNFGLGAGINVTLYEGGWEYGDFKLYPFNLARLDLYGGFTNAYQGFGAKATAFAPSVSFVIWDVPIEASFEIASIGAEIGYRNGEFHFGGAYGFGFDITIYLNEE